MNDDEKERIRQNFKNLGNSISKIVEDRRVKKVIEEKKAVKKNYKLGDTKINPPRF